MELMIQCCLMNGYCPYNISNDVLLSYIIMILMLIIVIDSIRK